MVEINQLVNIAEQIRTILLTEFPDNKVLRNQCKRASILFDLYCRKNKIKAYINAGYITKDGDKNEYNRGHVWNIVVLDKKKYLIDITLTQFEDYINKSIPSVIVLEEAIAKKEYCYIDDGYGKYKYKMADIRKNLVDKVMNI